jgi:hypothetical protein
MAYERPNIWTMQKIVWKKRTKKNIIKLKEESSLKSVLIKIM